MQQDQRAETISKFIRGPIVTALSRDSASSGISSDCATRGKIRPRNDECSVERVNVDTRESHESSTNLSRNRSRQVSPREPPTDQYSASKTVSCGSLLEIGADRVSIAGDRKSIASSIEPANRRWSSFLLSFAACESVVDT